MKCVPGEGYVSFGRGRILKDRDKDFQHPGLQSETAGDNPGLYLNSRQLRHTPGTFLMSVMILQYRSPMHTAHLRHPESLCQPGH